MDRWLERGAYHAGINGAHVIPEFCQTAACCDVDKTNNKSLKRHIIVTIIHPRYISAIHVEFFN